MLMVNFVHVYQLSTEKQTWAPPFHHHPIFMIGQSHLTTDHFGVQKINQKKNAVEKKVDIFQVSKMHRWIKLISFSQHALIRVRRNAMQLLFNNMQVKFHRCAPKKITQTVIKKIISPKQQHLKRLTKKRVVRFDGHISLHAIYWKIPVSFGRIK